MSVNIRVVNVAVAANAYIDSAKARLAKLAELCADPVNKVNPASIEKVEAALSLVTEADAELADFASINSFTLS